MSILPTTRGLVSEALTDRGYVLSGTVTDDAGGGGTITEVAGGTIICRLDALGGQEGQVANRLSDRSTHLLTLLASTAISTEDDFVVDGRGTFEVTAVREHTDELARMVEVVPRS